jgi:hypothetical protein
MRRTIFSLFLTFFEVMASLGRGFGVGTKENEVLSLWRGQRSGLGRKRKESEPARGSRLQATDLLSIHDAPDKIDSLGHNIQYNFCT